MSGFALAPSNGQSDPLYIPTPKRILPNRECTWSSTPIPLRPVHLGHVKDVASFTVLDRVTPSMLHLRRRLRIHVATPHDRASRRKPDEPLLDPPCTFLLCPTCPRPTRNQNEHRNTDAGERRTFVGDVQVAAHGEAVGDARKHLEKVARLVAHQDIFRTTSCLERERKVDLCHTIKKGGGQLNRARVESNALVGAHPSRRGGGDLLRCEPIAMMK
jgi:hypothetical protein